MQLELRELLHQGNCLTCHAEDTLPVFLVDQRGVPSGQEGHTFVYEHIVVVMCSSCKAGYVENHNHDCFDFEEVWDQAEWYTLDVAYMATLLGLIGNCPQPLSPECGCPAHKGLRASCSELPARGWHWALESDAHVHQVSLEIKDGVPALRPS